MRRRSNAERLRAVFGLVVSCFLATGSLAVTWADRPASPVSFEERLELLRELIAVGNSTEAEAGSRELLAEVEATAGPESIPATAALALLLDALLDGGKARQPETRSLAERLVELSRVVHGEDDVEFAESLNRLGRVLYLNDELPAAKELFERVRTIRESVLGPLHVDVARSLSNIAMIAATTDDLDTALPLFERAVEIARQNPGLDARLMSGFLMNLANALLRPGELERARDLYKEALDLHLAVYGPEHWHLARIYNNLGNLLIELEEYASAMEMLERSLELRRKHYGLEHERVARALFDIAHLLDAMGDFDGAVDFHRQALTMRENIFGPEDVRVANALLNFAVSLIQMADYAGARDLLERAEAIFRDKLPPGEPGLGLVLINLSEVLVNLGDTERAYRLSAEALAIQEQILGPEHPGMVDALLSLGDRALDRGRIDEANRLYQRGARIARKAGKSEGVRFGRSLVSLGNAHFIVGEYAEAQTRYERALGIFDRVLGPESFLASAPVENLGEIAAVLGDTAKAGELYERALRILKKYVGDDHPEIGTFRKNLATLRWVRGDLAGALEESIQAEIILREAFRRSARSLSEAESLRYEPIRRSGLDLAISLLLSSRTSERPQDDATEKVWDEIVRSRAMVLDEMASRRRALAVESDEETAELARVLLLARNRLARFVVQGPDPRQPLEYASDLARLSDEKERGERDLARRSSSFEHQLAAERIGLSDVAAALPPGTRLVAYVEYEKRTRPAEDGVPSYAAFVLRASEARPTAIDLGPRKRIDALIRRWQQEAASAPNLPIGGGRAERRYREVGLALREAIWDPVVQHSQQAKIVFVVPDGAINLISIATLPARKSGYLVETGPLVHYLSAERDLASREPRDRYGQGVLVVGGPDFEADPAKPGGAMPQPAKRLRAARASCSGFRQLRFDPLPAARAEAEEIGSFWAETGNAEVTTLIGPLAEEGRFKALAPGQRILHLATHGFFVEEGCDSSARAAAVRSRGTLSQLKPPPAVLGDNPLLLTGLALAAANRRREAPHDGSAEDGMLTAEEISALDLSTVSWAVLSGCETGTGVILSGEGVLGLRRAFEVAGVGTLIMSLWSVEDIATRLWMGELYAARLSGRSTPESIRDASLAIIETRRRDGLADHPFFWGAFVAAGDWR